MRECHVRFCERLGVRLPGATLPERTLSRNNQGAPLWSSEVLSLLVAAFAVRAKQLNKNLSTSSVSDCRGYLRRCQNDRSQVHESLLNVVLLGHSPDHNAQKPAILSVRSYLP